MTVSIEEILCRLNSPYALFLDVHGESLRLSQFHCLPRTPDAEDMPPCWTLGASAYIGS